MPHKKRVTSIPTRPIDVYKKIIDDLIQQTPSRSGEMIVKDGIYSKGQGDFGKQMNKFVSGLSPKQKADLAEMLTSERQGAIGDVLSMLSWWVTCHGLTFSVHGEPMPVELSGMGLHGDYVGRLDGWNWPQESDFSQ